MTVSSRGSSRAAALLIRTSNPRICRQCLFTINTPLPQRRAASAAAVLKPLGDHPPQSAPPQTTSLPPVSASQTSEYTIRSGLLLSRPPLLTKPLSAFEQAFFFYQKRLNERLVMPFTRYFYFKKDEPADFEWKLKAKERNGQPARELGGYSAYDENSWNDELLVGDNLSETNTMIDALVKDSEVRAVEGKDGKPLEVAEGMEEKKAVEKPLSRLTEADLKFDQRRLDRALGRTLYLVVKKGEAWELPSDDLVGRESLKQGAERILVQSAGINMNTWIIGHAPVGHLVKLPTFAKASENELSTLEAPGQKTFFMKARIMAGQADLAGNKLGYTDYKWLTKGEVQKAVGSHYFARVKNMMADR